MKLHYNEAQMLDAWRRLRGMAPLRDDMNPVRTDGIDFSSRLKAEMDAWYAEALEVAPPALLAPEDGTQLEATIVAGGLRVELPEGTVRVIAAQLSGWKVAVCEVVTPDSPRALMQLCELTRACEDEPVAVFDRSGRSLVLYPADARSSLVRLELVVRREGTYSFDRALLANA